MSWCSTKVQSSPLSSGTRGREMGILNFSWAPTHLNFFWTSLTLYSSGSYHTKMCFCNWLWRERKGVMASPHNKILLPCPYILESEHMLLRLFEWISFKALVRVEWSEITIVSIFWLVRFFTQKVITENLNLSLLDKRLVKTC